MGFLLLSHPVVNSTAFKITALTVALEPFCWNLLFHHILGWWRRLIFFHRVFFFLFLHESAIFSFLEYHSRKLNFQNCSWKGKLLFYFRAISPKVLVCFCTWAFVHLCTCIWDCLDIERKKGKHIMQTNSLSNKRW